MGEGERVEGEGRGEVEGEGEGEAEDVSERAHLTISLFVRTSRDGLEGKEEGK